MPENLRTVYVVGWHYDGGGGFDWYFTPTVADVAYEKEKETARELADSEWEAYRFEYQCDPALTNDEVTDEIDADLDALCVSASQSFRAF